VYFPHPMKIWFHGHEYAKRKARAEGVGFTELDNGFATTENPAALQRIYDTLTSGVIRVFSRALVGPATTTINRG
jgi:hypothetical protein